MNKKIFLCLLFILLFYFNFAKAEVYFSQPNSDGYTFYENVPFGHYGRVYKGDDGSLRIIESIVPTPFIADFGGYTDIYLGGNGAKLPYPIAASSNPSYVSDIILDIRDSNKTENLDYAVYFWCYGPGDVYLGGVVSDYVNSSSFSEDNFKQVDFHFSVDKCDLSVNKIHSITFHSRSSGVLGFTPIEVRNNNYNLVTGYGVAGENGIIVDDYESKITILTRRSVIKKDPVLIVPGVLGTDIFKGEEKLWLDLGRNFTDINDQFMDSLAFEYNLSPSVENLKIAEIVGKPSILFDYSDGLIQEFKNQGYTQGTSSTGTLFTFPYDWRYGVSGKYDNGKTNSDLLKEKIQEIKLQTGASKVDVVAHSTGGLLVKKYVIDNSTNNSIGKAVFVGVPELGAPKAIKTLIIGDNFGIPWLEQDEMKKLALNFPVVYDLMPSQKYFNTKGSYVTLIDNNLFSADVIKQLNPSESENYLQSKGSLNSLGYTNSQNLHTENFDSYDMRNAGVDVYNITGCKNPTLGTFVEKRDKDIYGNSIISYSRPGLISGDATVPFESSNNVNSDFDHKFYAIKADHGKMLSQLGVREKIVNIISGSQLNSGSSIITSQQLLENPKKCELSGKVIKIYSPLDIEIYDQYGNRLGFAADRSLQNDIAGASFEVYGDHKFVFIPNDEGQEYVINLKGTGVGTFTLGMEDIIDGMEGASKNFINIPVDSNLLGGLDLVSSQLKLDINGDGVIDQAIEPNSILNENESQDLVSPVSTSTIAGIMGDDGFYRSEVVVTLSAFDPIINNDSSKTSGLLSIKYKLDGGDYIYCSSQVEECLVTVVTEGSHTLTFFSTDRAGNNEQGQEISFIIDKTLPEIIAEFNPIIKGYVFSSTDILNCNSNECSAVDKAGNLTILKYTQQFSLLNTTNLIFKSISYNGAVNLFNPNLLSVSYKLSRGVIIGLSQTELIQNQQVLNIVYSQKQNQSIITSWNGNLKSIVTQAGLRILQLKTNHGKIITVVK